MDDHIVVGSYLGDVTSSVKGLRRSYGELAAWCWAMEAVRTATFFAFLPHLLSSRSLRR
jgi:hypothetical protein